jgi:hypothetical protein
MSIDFSKIGREMVNVGKDILKGIQAEATVCAKNFKAMNERKQAETVLKSVGVAIVALALFGPVVGAIAGVVTFHQLTKDASFSKELKKGFSEVIHGLRSIKNTVAQGIHDAVEQAGL